nr:MAG TPA: hypothetical protein [Caudoviricetes sp.]
MVCIAFSRDRGPSVGVKERSFLLGQEPIITVHRRYLL